jgi:hypothetical protein
VLTPQEEQRFSQLVDSSLTGYMSPWESVELNVLKKLRDAPDARIIVVRQADPQDETERISAWLARASHRDLTDLIHAVFTDSNRAAAFVFTYIIDRT